MSTKAFALSTLNGRLLMCDGGKAGEADANYVDITDGLTKTSGITTSKTIKEYSTVNNGGWVVLAVTGQKIEDVTLSYVRLLGTNVYETLRNWNKETLGDSDDVKDFIFMIPNEEDTYNATVIHVVNKKFTHPGLDATIGQEFSVTVGATHGIEYYKGTLDGNVPTLTPVE